MRHRLHSLDYLRIGAVFFVVLQHAGAHFFFHTHGTRAYVFLEATTYWGMPALFLLSGYLSGPVEQDGWVRRRRRLMRLLGPYVLCGAAILGILAVREWSVGLPVHAPSLAGLATGHAIYFTFWFLPMLTYCTLIGWAFPSRRSSLIAAAASLLVWATVAFVLRHGHEIGHVGSDAGFLLHLPFFASLYLLGRGLRSYDIAVFESIPLAAAAALAVAALGLESFVAGALMPPQRTVGLAAISASLSAVSGLAVLLLALNRARRLPPLPAFWSSVAPLGIYLVHPAFLRLVAALFPATGRPWLLWVPLTAILAFAGSAATILLASHLPLLRPALGMPMAEAS